MAYESWIDRQIREAMDRGEFDNLPGAGQPIAGLTGRDDPDWWVRGLMERENLKPVLPTTLLLRKQVEELQETIAEVRSETEVREIIATLNRQIAESYRRRLDGPMIIIHMIDTEAAVAEWRSRQG